MSTNLTDDSGKDTVTLYLLCTEDQKNEFEKHLNQMNEDVRKHLEEKNKLGRKHQSGWYPHFHPRADNAEYYDRVVLHTVAHFPETTHGDIEDSINEIVMPYLRTKFPDYEFEKGAIDFDNPEMTVSLEYQGHHEMLLSVKFHEGYYPTTKKTFTKNLDIALSWAIGEKPSKRFSLKEESSEPGVAPAPDQQISVSTVDVDDTKAVKSFEVRISNIHPHYIIDNHQDFQKGIRDEVLEEVSMVMNWPKN